jgi:hypothetical protein
MPDGVAVAQAMPSAVEVPTTLTTRTDSFIDELTRLLLNRKQLLRSSFTNVFNYWAVIPTANEGPSMYTLLT